MYLTASTDHISSRRSSSRRSRISLSPRSLGLKTASAAASSSGDPNMLRLYQTDVLVVNDLLSGEARRCSIQVGGDLVFVAGQQAALADDDLAIDDHGLGARGRRKRDPGKPVDD